MSLIMNVRPMQNMNPVQNCTGFMFYIGLAFVATKRQAFRKIRHWAFGKFLVYFWTCLETCMWVSTAQLYTIKTILVNVYVDLVVFTRIAGTS